MSSVHKSLVSEGTAVIADGGLTCIAAGAAKTVERDGIGLYVQCANGKHYLEGQLDEGDLYIGFGYTGYAIEPQRDVFRGQPEGDDGSTWFEICGESEAEHFAVCDVREGVGGAGPDLVADFPTRAAAEAFIGLRCKPGFRFSADGILVRATPYKEGVDAKDPAHVQFLVPLYGGDGVGQQNLTLPASIANEPSVVAWILGEDERGNPALVALTRDGGFVRHDDLLSSLSGSTTMAEGVAQSSAAPEARSAAA